MSESKLNNEKELLIQIAEGDLTAFDTIYWHYSPLLLRNLIKLLKSEQEAEELLQDIFLMVWERRADLSLHTGLGNYLFSVSRNLVTDVFRKAQRDKKLYARILAAATEEYTHIEETLLKQENEALLKKAIDSLPPVRQKVFRLCKLEGLSYEEVSRQLGISTSTISDHIVKATRSIREFVYAHQDIATAIILYSLLKGID